MKRHGRVDVLFNNAGIALRRPTIELSFETGTRFVAVNMTGVFLCAREAARHMLAGGRGGRIVNTASIMGISGGGLYPNISYQRRKGAVVEHDARAGRRVARQGIRVNAIAPTWVRTPLIRAITENSEVMKRIEEITPMGRIAEPEELVGAVLFLASRASAMVTGHVLAVRRRVPGAVEVHPAASGCRTSIAYPTFRRSPNSSASPSRVNVQFLGVMLHPERVDRIGRHRGGRRRVG